MSLFPNRDWAYIKTKLNRLPTKIFLPGPPDEPEYRVEALIEDGGGRRRHWPKPRKHGLLPTARNTTTSMGDFYMGDFYETSIHDDDDDLIDIAASIPPTGGRRLDGAHHHYHHQHGGGSGGSASASVFAAAALKEGVPPHVISRLMRAVGVGEEGAPRDSRRKVVPGGLCCRRGGRGG